MPDLVPHPLETLLRNRWMVNHLDGEVDDRFRYLIAEAGYPNKILDARKLIQAEIDRILSEPINVNGLILYQGLTRSEHTWMIHPRKKFIEFLRYIHRLCDQPRLNYDEWQRQLRKS